MLMYGFGIDQDDNCPFNMLTICVGDEWLVNMVVYFIFTPEQCDEVLAEIKGQLSMEGLGMVVGLFEAFKMNPHRTPQPLLRYTGTEAIVHALIGDEAGRPRPQGGEEEEKEEGGGGNFLN